MNYVIDVLIIILLFGLYSLIHSYIASIKVKEWFKRNFGDLIAFYRLGYNIFALASLYIIYELSPKPHLILYDLPNPYDLIILVPQFIALAGLFWAFKYICFKEFLGLNQVKRYFEKKYNSELDENLTLQLEGPFRYTRHPVYFFSILILLFRPTMDLFYLVFFIWLVIYFYIGSYFEEEKLAKHFGEIYTDYRKSVPRIFPVNFLNPYETKRY
jgi:protein-S-isoprenylcysteine O-methyltransferase Ste14